MNRDKSIDEMRHLADVMGKVISTEYERRVLADERKLEAVLKENGWCKASEVAREIFEEIDDLLHHDERDYDDLMDSETVPEIYTEYLACSNYICGARQAIAELKKKYTGEVK